MSCHVKSSQVMLCHVMSCQVMSCVMLCVVMSSGVMSRNVMSCRVMWCGVLWCGSSCTVMWCDAMCCAVTWHDVLWCDVMWSDVQWCDAMRGDGMLCGCDAIGCGMLLGVRSCYALGNGVMWWIGGWCAVNTREPMLQSTISVLQNSHLHYKAIFLYCEEAILQNTILFYQVIPCSTKYYKIIQSSPKPCKAKVLLRITN